MKIRKSILFLLTIVILSVLFEIAEHIIDNKFFDGDGQLEFLRANLIISFVQVLTLLVISYSILYILVKNIKERKLQTIVFFLLSIFILIINLEIFLRLADIPQAGREDYVKAGWRLMDDYENINELGFRGQEINYHDSSIVVVILGDSQVEAKICDFDELPEQVLQTKLQEYNKNAVVFSLGSSGYGTDQEFLVLEEYFQKYRADIVLLWQTITNDIWNNMFPSNNLPHDGPIKPTFWINADGNLAGPNYHFEENITYLGNISGVKSKLILLINRFIYRANYHPEIGIDASWEIHLPEPYKAMTECYGDVKTDWDPSINKTHPYIKGENLANEKSHFAVGLIPESKRLEYGIELTRLLQTKIDSICDSAGAAFYIFYTLNPAQRESLNSEDDKYCYKIDSLYYLYSESEIIKRQRSLNTDFYTFEIPVFTKDWTVSEYDTHLNPIANKEVMQSLADSVFQIQKNLVFRK